MISSFITPALTPPADGLRQRMNYMRGIAILTVLFGHFTKAHTTIPIPFFAGYFIAFFFFISGYGIQHSLASRVEKLGLGRGLAAFYWKRAVRLYPVFWIFLGLKLALGYGRGMDSLDLSSVLLVQFHSPDLKWFLHAIVLCYLVAPLLYYTVRASGTKAPLVMTALWIASIAVFHLLGLPEGRCWYYLFVPFGSIYLFGLGMAMVPALPTIRPAKSNVVFALTALAMVALFAITFFMKSLGPPPLKEPFLPFGWNLLLPAMLYGSVIAFSLQFFTQDRRPPLLRFMNLVGSVSLTLYVFEGVYLNILKKLGVIHGTNFWNAGVYILLLPLFVFGAWVFERYILSGAVLRSLPFFPSRRRGRG